MKSAVRNVNLFQTMSPSYLSALLIFILASFSFSDSQRVSNYYGKHIGALKSYHHALQGDVFAVDSRTLHIRNFNYDGEGPAGYLYVSNENTPDANGIKLRDEHGSSGPLKKYRKKHITITLPEGKTIQNFKWFYVWCDDFSVNFGDVKIPRNMDFPKPQKIGRFSGVHSVSSDNVVVVDAQTLLIPSFSYDGEAPDAKFWVGAGTKPTTQGIRVPDENGKEEPLRRYDRKTIVLTLPGDVTVFDIGNFAIWCEAFTVDFGHITFPKDLNVPPSLKMLGVSPQSKLNCEILHDDLAFEVRWAVAGDSIVIQLVAKLEKGEYMSFGLSGQLDQNLMVGGDVVVAWIDQETLNGYAYDYYLKSKSQCAGNHGSCPDTKLKPNSESVRLLNAALVNGYSIITYQRPLRAIDDLDLPIYTNGSQAAIWAIGTLNSLQEVSYHSIASRSTTLIDFGRSPQWNCPIPESDASVGNSEDEEDTKTSTHSTLPNTKVQTQTEPLSNTRIADNSKDSITYTTTRKAVATPAPVKKEKPWDIPPVQCYEPEDGIFYAQMGPTGGKHGYSAITGHVGWGIAWYINGLLIPEVNVVRGRTYTFVVEGGLDPETPAKYHPFYITDDPVGGFQYKTPEERAKVKIFAGVMQSKEGEYIPTGIGRLCNWTPDQDQPPSDDFTSFGAYQRTLSLVCDHGEPGVVQWTPDENTPNVVYYQCFNHRYLGWKINVHDTCDKETAASEQVTTRVLADDDNEPSDGEGELDSKPSIQINTFVKHTNSSSYQSKDQNVNVKDVNSIGSQIHPNQVVDAKVVRPVNDVYMEPPQVSQSLPSQFQTNYVPSYQNIQYTVGTEKPDYSYSSRSNLSTSQLPGQKNRFTHPHKESHYGYYPPVHRPPPPSYYPPDSHSHVMKHPPYLYNPNNPSSMLYKGFQSHHRQPLINKKPPKPVPPLNYYPQPAYKIPVPILNNKPIESMSANLNMKNYIVPQEKDIPAKAPQVVPHPMKKHQHVPLKKHPEEITATKTFINRFENPVDQNNNGFNPNSIIIEGGFKPITPSSEVKNIAQERMSVDNSNEDYVDQTLKELDTENLTSYVAEGHSKNPFEGKQPELFEPIFIPSPIINEQLRRNESQKKIKVNKPYKSEGQTMQPWPTLGDSMSDIQQMKSKGKPQYESLFPVNTVSQPYFDVAGKPDDKSSSSDNVKNIHQLPIMSAPYTGVVHNYKVTENEYDNFNVSQPGENNLIPETTITSAVTDNIQENNIGSTQNNLFNGQFLIKIADGESNDSLNTTIINL